MAGYESTDAGSEKTIFQWLRSRESCYTAHGPFDKAGGDKVDFTFHSTRLSSGTPLKQVWKDESMQLKVYDMILDAGLVTRLPSFINRSIRDKTFGTIKIPCLSLTICGERSLFTAVARDVYDYIYDQLGALRYEDSLARTAGMIFMVELYDNDRVSDFQKFAIMSTDVDEVGGRHVLAELLNRLPEMAGPGYAGIHLYRMMAPFAGPWDGKEDVVKIIDGKEVVISKDHRVTTIVIAYHEGTMADFDGLLKAFGNEVQQQDPEGRVQVRLLESRA